jgi:AraC-like DNA-binding protein
MATSSKNGFWRLRSFGLQQRVDPKSGWWFRNAERDPRDVVILQYAVSGKMIYRDPRGEVEVHAGHAALFAFREPSEYGVYREFTEPFGTQFFVLDGVGLLEHCDALRSRFGSVFYLGHEHPILLRLRELCGRPAPRSSTEECLAAAEIYSIIMRLYTHLDELHAREKSPVERALDELTRHTMGSLSLKEVALRHGCSREHLARVFAQRVGTSPARFLKRARLERALELLRETRLSVRLVAEQCGFASKHTLARWVRLETGTTPGKYRARAAQLRTED